MKLVFMSNSLNFTLKFQMLYLYFRRMRVVAKRQPFLDCWFDSAEEQSLRNDCSTDHCFLLLTLFVSESLKQAYFWPMSQLIDIFYDKIAAFFECRPTNTKIDSDK